MVGGFTRGPENICSAVQLDCFFGASERSLCRDLPNMLCSFFGKYLVATDVMLEGVG